MTHDQGGPEPPVLGVQDFAGLRFHFRPGTVDERVLGGDYHAQRFFAPGYEPAETDTVLDVGAHIGVFTALAAQRVPRGMVHAVEPAAENCAILRRNVAANDLANVAVHQVALSDLSGEVSLYHHVASWGHTIYEHDAPAGAAAETVRSQTLGEFFAEHGIGRVDYMKMNIEGAEYDLLLRTSPEVLRVVQFMLVELHPAEDELAERLMAWLRDCGFRTDAAWVDDPTFKGWVTARQA